ncbi:MAG: response regulator, partial [Cyanobacteria bacterium J083]
LLRKIEEMFALKAKYQNLKLTFQKETDIPRYIKTDEGKLRQVLINLLSNAFKFTEQGQVIVRISLKKSDKKINSYYSNLNYLHFEVEDTGCGIDEYEIGKLFSPFEQTESGIRSQEGTGLGLPISQKFVQQMGGDITVSSIVGKGSVFAFDISIKLAQATEIPVAKAKKIIGLKDKNTEYRILVVDDIPQGRLLLVQLLSSIGFHVIDAENGEEAVNIWQKWQPHLILMDMRMPVMDGYEATRQIKAKGTETIIIALTASAFQEETAGILAAGCDDFVSKPFEDKLLLHKIAEHLKIDYLYESDKSQAIIPPRSLSANQQLRELSADDLKVMPLAWIIKLHQAANRVNNREIFALIGEITAINSDLATKIANLVHNFRCDYLVTVTESIIDQQDKMIDITAIPSFRD